MFEKIDDIVVKLEGAYRKLKSYYYYNKSFLPIREKIVEFEYDSKKMQATIKKLANILIYPKKETSQLYLEHLYNQIDFYALPKKFETNLKRSSSEEYPASNARDTEKILTEVNFFINAPIELHIIDVFWTLLFAKKAYDKRIITYRSYGNSVRKDVISEKIDFESNRFFKHFFYQYNNWRNGAFDALKKNYEEKKNSVLFTLDLKSYYYSVKINFEEVKPIFQPDVEIESIYQLTDIQEKIFSRYKEIIKPYRKGVNLLKKNEYPLPIGLFSSMVLGNAYLSEFDKSVEKTNPVFYGRYVDDILIVYESDVDKEEKKQKIIKRLLCNSQLLKMQDHNYVLDKFPNLMIQKDKVNVVCLRCDEPRTILDVYDKTIRVVPSQMSPLPDFDMELGNFEEKIYDVKNLTKSNKIKDIGQIDISNFEIGRFFSSLLSVFSKMKFELNDERITKNIDQIEKFFKGSNCIEYYPYWVRYVTFLIIQQKFRGPEKDQYGNVKKFYDKIKLSITQLVCSNLKKEFYQKQKMLEEKIKESLESFLNVCLYTGLALDIKSCKFVFDEVYDEVKKYVSANYFDDSLIPIPMANYFDYDSDVSYLRMDLNLLNIKSLKYSKNKKFRWSPRFIHFDEILLLAFYKRLITGKTDENESYTNSSYRKIYEKVNHLKINRGIISGNKMLFDEDYCLEKINIALKKKVKMDSINIGVASFLVNLDPKNPTDTWTPYTYEYKKTLNTILKGMWENCKIKKESKSKRISLLVLPELSVPFFWVKDLIRFCEKTNIAIIAGLKYIEDKKKLIRNYILNIFPFQSNDKFWYTEAFVCIREKNDYSPPELRMLSKVGKKCKDRKCAEYQIFCWRGLNISSQVCYELTDILARALLKGRCDILAVPVLNKDTTYFSKIISSTARDVHCFIAQSNTSEYGDSRISGPYDRDSKDIVRLKGGVNDNVIIGVIDLQKYRDYQLSYKRNLRSELQMNINSYNSLQDAPERKKDKEKPDIKPFPARFSLKK